jgi:hypothetical protein
MLTPRLLFISGVLIAGPSVLREALQFPASRFDPVAHD